MRASAAAEALADGRDVGGTATKTFASTGAVGSVTGAEVMTSFWRGRNFRRGLRVQSEREAAACVREAET